MKPLEEQNRIRRAVGELNRIFRESASRHQAHERSRLLLEELSTDRGFITSILYRYLSTPEVLNSKHYPVVGINVELNAHYHLVANCWIPLPNRDSDVSTKAIHHHGTLLMTTTTIFGPGYEHWLFSRPEEVDPERELYAMKVTNRRFHPQHDIAFVDAFEPHLPMYPRGLTITLALWSKREKTTWKDRLKRVPLLKVNEAALGRLARRVGLAQSLGINCPIYYDFTPTENGFKGMKERIEFQLGPNEDYLQSLFHILQQTQNDRLIPLIEQHLDSSRVPFTRRPVIEKLVEDLRQGRSIEGRLSDCHLGVPHVTFRSSDIERTVATLNQRQSA